LRFKVLAEQTKFHHSMLALLQSWEGCGFPHVIVGSHLKRFVAWYLQLYTGPCVSSSEFLSRLSQLPEHLASSAVMNELISFQSISPERKKEYGAWFEETFAKDMAATYQKVVQIDQIPESHSGSIPRLEKLGTEGDLWRRRQAHRCLEENGKVDMSHGRHKEKSKRAEEIFEIMARPIEEEVAARGHGWVKLFPDELLGK
jgi:hypothetical protein